MLPTYEENAAHKHLTIGGFRMVGLEVNGDTVWTKDGVIVKVDRGGNFSVDNGDGRGWSWGGDAHDHGALSSIA